MEFRKWDYFSDTLPLSLLIATALAGVTLIVLYWPFAKFHIGVQAFGYEGDMFGFDDLLVEPGEQE